MQDDQIEIGLAKESERDQAAAFIDEQIIKWYQCRAHPAPSLIFIAKQSERIVGTMTLCFTEKDEQLPLETIYDFDYAQSPLPLVRETTAQFGRWIATIPNISAALVYVPTIYAMQQGKLTGISEVKPKIAERFKELGVELHDLPGTLILDQVPEYVRPYYTIPPVAQPCIFSLSAMKNVLDAQVEPMINRGDIVLV